MGLKKIVSKIPGTHIHTIEALDFAKLLNIRAWTAKHSHLLHH